MSMDPAGNKFHLDKRIPVVLILAMVGQLLGILVGAGMMIERYNSRFEKGEMRLTILEGRMDSVSTVPTDIAVIRSEVSNITDTLGRIEDELIENRKRE